MTDRELLELAAKAAGIKWLPATTEKGIELEPKFGLWLVIDGEPNEYQRRRWNPLTDDGDALRLAVKLGMVINTYYNGGAVAGNASISCDYDQPEYGYQEGMGKPDLYAATRHAIVRTAAEIGKAMENEH